MTGPPALFDRALLRLRRQRSADLAPRSDFLLRRAADDLAERLHLVNRSFPVALDLMAHHGVIARRLGGMANVGVVISLEEVPGLLAQCPVPRLSAGPEQLPFAAGSLDLVVSGVALHLVDDLPGTLLQVRRALKPDGLLLASLLGGATLVELRQSWLEAEAEIFGGASPRVAPFADVRDLGALLQRAGFAMPVVDAETVRVTYQSPLALTRDLKTMGASNMLRERSRIPVSRRLLNRVTDIYRRRFGLPDGRIAATFEIMTLTAWAPSPDQPKPLRPGSATHRLADALKVQEHKP